MINIPKNAKVAMLIEPKKFEIKEFQIPEIGDDEMLIRVEACGICGTDGPVLPRNEFS